MKNCKIYSLIGIGLVSASGFAQVNGFSNGTNWTRNNYSFYGNDGPSITGDTLTLTDNVDETNSAWFNTQQSVSHFSVAFDYQMSNVRNNDGPGNGFTFTLQNDLHGNHALGNGGGGLGYHAIQNSVGVTFNVWNGYTVGEEVVTDGNRDNKYNATAPLDMANGDLIHVALSYDGTTLTENLTDATNSTSYTNSYVLDIAGTVTSPNAYIGFTGGTDVAGCTQTITNFSYTTQAAPEPITVGVLALGVVGILVRRKQ